MMSIDVKATHCCFRVLDRNRRRPEWPHDLAGHGHRLLLRSERTGNGRSPL